MVVITPKSKPLTVYLNPLHMFLGLWQQRQLIHQLAARNIHSRFKGSALGLAWSILYPLLMLAVYTFVFSMVFKVRWGQDLSGSSVEFAITLFCGLVLFNLFSECTNQAPRIITGHSSFVKKAVFPLEILPVSTLISSAFFLGVSVLILLAGKLILLQSLPLTAFCFPLTVVPLLMFTAGLSWLLASLGVYLRDVGQIVSVIVQMLFFSTPIFYPLAAVPKSFQTVIRLNPLTGIVETGRRTLMWGQWPEWSWLLGMTLISFAVAQLGYAWFMKTKRGFADVI